MEMITPNPAGGAEYVGLVFALVGITFIVMLGILFVRWRRRK